MTSATSNLRQISWLRIGAEATVIVVSILLAFAIDAWWAERVERRMESEVLERFHAEFAANRDLIAAMKEECTANCRAQKGSDQVYEWIDQALKDSSGTVSISDTFLEHLLGAGTFAVETPVYDGLVRSGRVEVIQDQRVSAAIEAAQNK